MLIFLSDGSLGVFSLQHCNGTFFVLSTHLLGTAWWTGTWVHSAHWISGPPVLWRGSAPQAACLCPWKRVQKQNLFQPLDPCCQIPFWWRVGFRLPHPSPPSSRNFTSSFSAEPQIMQLKLFPTVADSVAPGAWTRMWWNPVRVTKSELSLEKFSLLVGGSWDQASPVEQEQSSFSHRYRAAWVYFVTLVMATTRPSM